MTFAESGQEVNSRVRSKRGAFARFECYRCGMKTRIKELRIARGLTVEALAKEAGVSKSHMSDLENGKKTLNTPKLAAIARALKVAPVDLLSEDDMGEDLLAHIRLMRRLSPADRSAVIRHAQVLDPGTGDE